MATIQNDRDVLLQAAGTRVETVTMPNWNTVDFGNVVGTTKPADNADVTTTVLGASGTAVVMTSSALFKSSSGVGGVFIGAGGLIGKNTSGVTTFSINATTGAAFFGGNIDTTGQAHFGGAYSLGGNLWSVVANDTNGALGGIYGAAASILPGVEGNNTGGGAGVSGISATGNGVNGNSAGTGTGAVSGSATGSLAFGGSFFPTGGGTALLCAGPFKWQTYTYAAPAGTGAQWLRDDGSWGVLGAVVSGSATGTAVLTGKPGANSNSVFVAMNIGGTTYDFVAFPR